MNGVASEAPASHGAGAMLEEGMQTRGTPILRRAQPSDVDTIGALMCSSILDLFPAYYDGRQTASAAIHIAHVDTTLIEDGTYFVHEINGEIISCGGWSRRGMLFMGAGSREGDDRLLDPRSEAAHIRAMFVRSDWTRRGIGRQILDAGHRAALAEGFHALDLMAMLPGVPLYRAYGFRDLEECIFTMPDGVAIEAIRMQRPI